MKITHGLHLAMLLSLVGSTLLPVAHSQNTQEPFKLGVQEQGYATQQGGASYPSYPSYPTYQAPKLQPSQPRQGHADSNVLQGNAVSQPPRNLTSGASQRVVLPPQFLGAWNVQGQRVKVEASPEFQAGAESAFAGRTNNIWQISSDGNGGYVLGSNTGIKTALVVDGVQGSTAFIRYQHPIGNTMAQEAIVMTLQSGAARFNGLERITIVKQGQPPRARVEYQLTGTRQ